jgi:hypothetical protein
MKPKLLSPEPAAKAVLDRHAAQNARTKAARTKQASGPEVGVFWLYKGNVLSFSQSLDEAEDFAGYKTFGTGHDKVWLNYQRAGIVPRDLDYDEIPRGRIVYSIKKREFILYADACIQKNKRAMSTIMKDFHLRAANTKVESDEHYICPKCAQREPEYDEEDW